LVRTRKAVVASRDRPYFEKAAGLLNSDWPIEENGLITRQTWAYFVPERIECSQLTPNRDAIS